MARSKPDQYPVTPTPEQRERPEHLTRIGSAPAAKVRHARVPPLSDGGRPGGRPARDRIADAPGMHVDTVDRLRERFALAGEEPALSREARAEPPGPPGVGGRVEAHPVAICCPKAPGGRTRWTPELSAGELRRRGLVTSVGIGTARRAPEKTTSSRGGSSAGASRSGRGRGS